MSETQTGSLGQISCSRRAFLKQATCLTAALTLSPAARATQNRMRRSARPPQMIQIPDYMIYAPLPGGKVLGILGGLREGKAVAAESEDSGESWTESQPLFSLDPSIGGWSLHNGFLDRDGELQLIYTNDANTTKHSKSLYDIHYDIWHVRSRNRRRNWEPPTSVWKGYAGSLLSFLQMRNGRVILPFTFLSPRTWAHRGEGPDAYAFMGRFSSTCAFSDDNGSNWTISPSELKEPTPQIGDDGGIEPIVLELKDTRLWMLIRTQWGRFYESYSTDGSLWTTPVPTRIISSDSPCSLTRLRDGRIVMMWNNTLRFCYANGGRAVLHGAISEDDGKTWRGYREIAANPLAKEPPPPNGDHGVTYTVPALTEDGYLITSLSTGPGGGYYLLRVDPEWLYETRREDRFAEGLQGWSTFGTRGVELTAKPGNSSRQVLAIRKIDENWPCGAVWNFPAGRRGTVQIRFYPETGMGDTIFGLTDHFSVPFDAEDMFHNLFNFQLGRDGSLSGGNKQTESWHDLVLAWDTERRQCDVAIDGRTIAQVAMQRESVGPSYLRLRPRSPRRNSAGLLVESVAADVTSSWA